MNTINNLDIFTNVELVDTAGPKGWPLLGSIFSFSATPYLDLFEWVKKYGHIVTFKFFKYR